MVFGAANGSSIALSEMPDRIPPPYPVISLMVTGIEEAVEALKSRGATFQPPAPPDQRGSDAAVAPQRHRRADAGRDASDMSGEGRRKHRVDLRSLAC